MGEGSPRRVAVAPPRTPVDEEDKFGKEPPPERSRSTTPGSSRWRKLRTTVHLSGAVSHHRGKPPLKREDSFLKRFSTRPPSHAPPLAAPQLTPAEPGWLRRAVLNPDESLLVGWLWLVTACGLYNAWTLIAREAFPELQVGGWWLWLDWCTDTVYWLDVAVQFRTGYLEQGIMVRDGRRLAAHYARSRDFCLDVAALAPLPLFGRSPLLRFPRFLKARRIYKFYYAVESRTAYPNLWRVANLIHVLLLLAHWFGCFYYMLSELEGFQGGWAYQHPPGGVEKSPLVRKYLGSVYWSTLTLTTIGDLATPATNLQYLFTIISYLIGVFIFATIVGQVGNVITNRNASRLEFERLLDGAKLYMRHHKVPKGMQRRVQRWYDYSWSRGRMQGGGDIHSALGILPDKLKTELAIHVNLKTLKKVSIFQECQPEFLHDLVLKMKAYIFTPGDLVCRKGEVAREMFIIADGILQVINDKGQVLTHMRAGDFFGEIGILNLDGFNRRTADVRSVGYSELFSLSREDVLSAMKDYPEAEEILQTMGRRRLLEARLTNTTEKASFKDDSETKNETKMRKKGISLTYLLRKKDTQQYDIANFHKQKCPTAPVSSTSDPQTIPFAQPPKEEIHQNSTLSFNHVQTKPVEAKISSDEATRVTCLMEQITSKFRKRRKTPHFRTRRKYTWWYKISNLVQLRKKTFRTPSKHSSLTVEEEPALLEKREDLMKVQNRPSDKFQNHSSDRFQNNPPEKFQNPSDKLQMKDSLWQPPSKPSVSNWNRSELFTHSVDRMNIQRGTNRRQTLADGMLLGSRLARHDFHDLPVPCILMADKVTDIADSGDVSPMSSNYSLTPSTSESEGDDGDIGASGKVDVCRQKTASVQCGRPCRETELPEELRLVIRNIVMGIKDKVDDLIIETEQKTIIEINQLKERIKQQDALIEYLEMRRAKQAGDVARRDSPPTVVLSSPPNSVPEDVATSPLRPPSPGDLLNVKFEEEDMWLVEFPPNPPAAPSSTPKWRRHSSVEVGGGGTSKPPADPLFLVPVPTAEGQLSPRRFSESQARSDVVRLNSSFAAKVRRVLAKVRVNRESEDQSSSGGEDGKPSPAAFRWPPDPPPHRDKKQRRSSTGSTHDQQHLSGLFPQKGSNPEPPETKPSKKWLLPTIDESSSFERESPLQVQAHSSPLLLTDEHCSDEDFSVVIDMSETREDLQ